MEITTFTIEMPIETKRRLERTAAKGGKLASVLAAELVSKGLSRGEFESEARASEASLERIVESSFGRIPAVRKGVLISLAEDEEFGAY